MTSSTPTRDAFRDVDIVVVNWNTREMALRLAASLKEARDVCAKAGRTLRLIVIDNASSDGSADHLAEHAPWVQLIRAPRNGGFAYGVNLGVGAALAEGRNPWCLLINTDAELEPSAIESFVSEAEQTRDSKGPVGVQPAIFGPRIVDEHDGVQRSSWPDPRLRELLTEATLLGPLWRKLRGGVPPAAVARPDCVSGCVFLIHPDALRESGGFDERYFLYFEETDFCTRVRAAGAAVAHLPAHAFVHRGGLSAELDSERTFTTFRESGVRYFAVHGGALSRRMCPRAVARCGPHPGPPADPAQARQGSTAPPRMPHAAHTGSGTTAANATAANPAVPKASECRASRAP